MAVVADDETVQARLPGFVASAPARRERRSSATWRRSAAICCSARAAPISATRPVDACNKRDPGSGCSAMGGVNRLHAVLGREPSTASPAIRATSPRLSWRWTARSRPIGPRGRRRSSLRDLHRLPGDAPQVETMLRPGRTDHRHHGARRSPGPAAPSISRSGIANPTPSPCPRRRSPSTSTAATSGTRAMALGGVAAMPWRAHEAEEVLRGQRFDEDLARKAAERRLRAGAARRATTPSRCSSARRPWCGRSCQAAEMEG